MAVFAGLMAGWAAAAAPDYGPFRKALESGNAELARDLGRQVYTSLAVQGGGRGVYAKTGYLVASWTEAATDLQADLVKIYGKGDAKVTPAFSRWRQYDHSMSQAAGLVLADDEAGRFLKSYLGLCFDGYIKEILYTAQQGAGQKRRRRIRWRATAWRFSCAWVSWRRSTTSRTCRPRRRGWSATAHWGRPRGW